MVHHRGGDDARRDHASLRDARRDLAREACLAMAVGASAGLASPGDEAADASDALAALSSTVAPHAVASPVVTASIWRIEARPRPSKVEKVAAYADAALHRSDLTVAAIAVAVGVSRSALYRHFEPLGGIACFVRERRIAALRLAIAHPGERRSFAEIAADCGFASPSHASRRFKSRFGITPTTYRRDARLAAAGPG